MSDQEIEKCSVCGKTGQVFREYYYYDVKCDCCYGDQHFAYAHHCDTCTPRAPTRIQIILNPVTAVPCRKI